MRWTSARRFAPSTGSRGRGRGWRSRSRWASGSGRAAPAASPPRSRTTGFFSLFPLLLVLSSLVRFWSFRDHPGSDSGSCLTRRSRSSRGRRQSPRQRSIDPGIGSRGRRRADARDVGRTRRDPRDADGDGHDLGCAAHAPAGRARLDRARARDPGAARRLPAGRHSDRRRHGRGGSGRHRDRPRCLARPQRRGLRVGVSSAHPRRDRVASGRARRGACGDRLDAAARSRRPDRLRADRLLRERVRQLRGRDRPARLVIWPRRRRSSAPC